MSSTSIVACREVFDENSQPSVEEISDYAQTLGIDPESETHLLPLAKEGLMQALPAPWKAFYDETLETHYYFNEETKKTQWEHPLDQVYRDLVKKARDSSIHDDTCASVQDIPTYEEHTKFLERVETKVESDDDDMSSDEKSEIKDNASATLPGMKRVNPFGRPPLAPLSRIDKKLSDLRTSPLRRSMDNTISSKAVLLRNTSDRDLYSRPLFERPKTLFQKQHSETIDLKMHVLNSPEEENYNSLLSFGSGDRGLPLTGKGNMFLRVSKSDLPSPDTDKSLPLDSTKSDPPKGILREKLSSSIHRKVDALFGKPKQVASFEEDKKSVRFKLENPADPAMSPSSNSSSEPNEGQSSIISAAPPNIPSPNIPSSPTSNMPMMNPLAPLVQSSFSSSTIERAPLVQSPMNVGHPIVLAPLVARPPLPPRFNESPREPRSLSISEKDKDSIDGASPRRRVVRPPAADYIKPDLFQKDFQKISDIVRSGSPERASKLEPPIEKEPRPRSPLIPQKSKISINLMESIESETSIDSPDREFANLDLNDLDEFNDLPKDDESKRNLEKESQDTIRKEASETSEKSSVQSKASTQSKSPRNIGNLTIPQIKVPKLDLLQKQPKILQYDSDDSKKSPKEDSKLSGRSESKISLKSEVSDKEKNSEKSEVKIPQKVSSTPSVSGDLRSPRCDYSKPWSPLTTFKPLNKAVIAPQMKASDSSPSLGKTLPSPRLDGVILSQGKSSSDNVVVVYQFESQDENLVKPVKSPVVSDLARDMMERNKADERRRLEFALQKELESIRVEFVTRERRMKAELQDEFREAEEKFLKEKRIRLNEQAERHMKEMEETLAQAQAKHELLITEATQQMEERYKRDIENAAKLHEERMSQLREDYRNKLVEQQRKLEIENERALSDLHDQLQANLHRERARMLEENRNTIESIRQEHNARITDLRHDYRAEVERLRSQHACHLEELRARLAGERLAANRAPHSPHSPHSPHANSPHAQHDSLPDKYRCLKEKYARLKHDVKMSIERRNKRREMSMTTGSETEKSNSHKNNQSLEKCKEVIETSISAVIETSSVGRRNNNDTPQPDNKVLDNNNDEWKINPIQSPDTTQTSEIKQRPHKKQAVAFREMPRRRERDRNTNKDGATTDYQDSSDATTADERSKDAMKGHERRRCFTRLKSASTSRLNYSPKRGEGWSSPLESLRQQLRKLDDLEDQFPDLALQPAYSLRYPFTELGSVTADSPELEFVRHRALVEREGVRRARAALRRRRAALTAPTRPQQDEREWTELEVALHRARALLGEKEIRLRHIERALRRLPPPAATLSAPLTPRSQELGTDEQSSCSSGAESAGAAGAGAGARGAVLRSLRALHADVRDIWRALDHARAHHASPESSSCNPASYSHPGATISAPETSLRNNGDAVEERARGLRAWLQTAP